MVIAMKGLMQLKKPVDEASYIVFKGGDGRIYAKNGNMGMIEYSDVEATNVIQYAVNKANALGGGKVFIKSGTYLITKTINPKDNVVIEGEGWGTVLQYALSSPAPVIEGYNVSKVVLKNFVIDGMNIDSGGVDLIHFAHSSYIRIEGLEIRNKKGTYDGDAIDLDDVTYFWVLNNYIHDIDGKAIHPSNADSPPYYGSRYGVIAHNELINVNRVGQRHVISVSGDPSLSGATPPSDIIIIGNYIESSPGTGIFVAGVRISIIGNVVKNVGIGIDVQNFGSTASEAIDIIGNIVETTTAGHGITCYSPTAGLVKKVSIIGNSVRNTYKAGIQVTGATEVTVVSNNIHNPGWYDIGDASGTSKHVVSFNIVSKSLNITQSPRIVRGNIGYDTGAFKATGVSVTIGTGDAYGSATSITSPSGRISYFRLKITWGGTFGTGETATVKVEAIYSDGSTAYIEKSATSAGYLWLTDDDLLRLVAQGKDIVQLNVYAKTNLTSTSVTVTVDVFGTG